MRYVLGLSATIFALVAFSADAAACTMCNVEVRDTIAEQFWDMAWRVLAPFPLIAALFWALDRMK